MSSQDTKILVFNQFQKSDKVPSLIHADLESLIEKVHGCENNPPNSSTTKEGEHIPSAFSKSTISSLKSIENKLDVYSGKTVLRILKRASNGGN